MKRQPLTGSIARDEAVLKSDVGAVMCVPIAVDGRTEGAIYLARPQPGQVFTERELEAVGAITQLFALRRRPAVSRTASVEPHGDTVAAKAKAEAAEQKLNEAREDVRSLTERIHGLEGEALKLKQQIEIEKQNAVEAKREAERGRTEASKLEQGLHKTDEDVKKLKEALARAEDERSKLKESLKSHDEDRKQKTIEIEKLRDALKQNENDREALRNEIADHVRSGQEREDDIARLQQELDAVRAEATSTREGLEKAVADQLASSDALKQAMRATVPPMLADHVEGAAAEGRSLVTDVTQGPLAALYITLFGFDSWAARVDGAAVKRRLDHFCNSISLRARANGGRVQQVMGHAHLVMFPADAAAVRAAVRCALEIASLVPLEDDVGVASAMHVGASSSGFFGEGDSATLVEAGEALLVARGVAHVAHEPSFFATSTVQKLVAGDPAFAFAMAGPAAVVGGPTVLLYRVSAAEGGDG